MKIWLYGYYHRIRSTRKLWRFWRDHQKALRGIFKRTVQVAARTGAIGVALQALDGPKIQAAASTPQGWSKEYMEKRLEPIKNGLAQLATDGRKSYHPVEPEARRMKVGDTNRYVDNAQAIADAKAGVIVACEATRQENDCGQLVPMIQQARENLGVAAQNTVTLADTGYGAGADLQAAQENQMTVLVPPAEGTPARDDPYAMQHFH